VVLGSVGGGLVGALVGADVAGGLVGAAVVVVATDVATDVVDATVVGADVAGGRVVIGGSDGSVSSPPLHALTTATPMASTIARRTAPVVICHLVRAARLRLPAVRFRPLDQSHDVVGGRQ